MTLEFSLLTCHSWTKLYTYGLKLKFRLSLAILAVTYQNNFSYDNVSPGILPLNSPDMMPRSDICDTMANILEHDTHQSLECLSQIGRDVLARPTNRISCI